MKKCSIMRKLQKEHFKQREIYKSSGVGVGGAEQVYGAGWMK